MNRKRNKRFFAMLLALALIFTTIAGTGFAAAAEENQSDDAAVSDVESIEENTDGAIEAGAEGADATSQDALTDGSEEDPDFEKSPENSEILDTSEEAEPEEANPEENDGEKTFDVSVGSFALFSSGLDKALTVSCSEEDNTEITVCEEPDISSAVSDEDGLYSIYVPSDTLTEQKASYQIWTLYKEDDAALDSPVSSVDDDAYYVTTKINDEIYYLSLNDDEGAGSVTLGTDPALVYIETAKEDTDAYKGGMIRISEKTDGSYKPALSLAETDKDAPLEISAVYEDENEWFALGIVLDENEKLTAEAEEDDDNEGATSVIINDFNITFKSGATLSSDGTYIWNPSDTASGHQFVYRVDYTISGVDVLEPGQLVITLPAHILKDRDGNWADSFECAYMTREEAESSGATPEYVYEIRTDENGEEYVVIYNYTTITADQSGYIEFSYTTTESTLKYTDMGYSDEVKGSISVTGNDNNKVTDEDTADKVGIDTHATISSVSKQTPTLYTSWQSSWGDVPEDADSYYYLVWPIYTYVNKSTSPYNFTLYDTFSDLGGSVVAYRFTGSSTWVTPDDDGMATVYNQTTYGTRYGYALVKYSKQQAEGLLESSDSYTVKNTVTATVDPVDQIDEDTSASSSRSWTYEVPKYEHPTGSFYADKYGIYNYSSHSHSNKYVNDSEDLSSYELKEYLSNSNADANVTSIGNIKYYTYVHGYPYPWTLADGATGSEQDAIDGKYAQNSVTYSLTDDTFYLKAVTYDNRAGSPSISGTQQALDKDDYDISSLNWGVTMKTASYDSETKTWTYTTIKDYASAKAEKGDPEDGFTANTLYFYVKDGDGGWLLAATYNLETGTYSMGENDSNYAGASLISSASGYNIYFAEGVKGYKIETSNPYYYTCIDAYPVITLYRTDHIAQILTGDKNATLDTLNQLIENSGGESILTKISVTNEATGTVTQNKSSLYSRTATGTDYIQAVERDGQLQKKVTSASNSKINQEVTVSWQLTLNETYVDNEGSHFVAQNSGTFYDLLPAGGILDTSSIAVKASGSALSSSDYKVEVIENYNGTGRQMLIVRINEPTTTSYVLTFNTVHSWDSIADYGTDLLNSCAYETGNDDIADGTADNGGDITEKELMKNLTDDTSDDSAGTEKFMFAEASYDINYLLAASTGLIKQVRAEGDDDYSYETTTYSNGIYSYRIRYANNAITKTKNIILFDSLEYFYQSDKDTLVYESEWYGTLVGIDYSQMTKAKVAVVVYVSAIKGLNINDYYDAETETYNLDATDEDGNKIWVELSDFLSSGNTLADVHAVAVDARKDTDGDDFVLAEEESLTFTLYMQAPSKVESAAQEEITEDPISYNNIYTYRTTVSNNSNENTSLYHQDYTQIHYRTVADVNLIKVNADDTDEVIRGITYTLRGTSDYGTYYEISENSDTNGYITFENIEKGTYELFETYCNADWQLNTESYTVKIDAEGNVTIEGYDFPDEDSDGNWDMKDGRYLVTDEPRIHADITFIKRGSISKDELEGAVFMLWGTSDYGNDVLLYATSTSRGRVTFENVELGTYKIIETEAPEGYILNETEWTFKVSADGQATLYITNDDGELEEVEKGIYDYFYQIYNEPLHSFQFIKSSTYGTNIFVEGAEFTLTGVSDYGTEVKITATSGSQSEYGLVTFKGLEPGTYTLKETNVENAKAEGNDNLSFELDTKSYTVRINADGSFTIDGLPQTKIEIGDTEYELYNFKNTPSTGQVIVKKIWLDDTPDEERNVTGLDITISTDEPTADMYGGYVVTFDANGGYFPNASTEYSLNFLKNGTQVGSTKYVKAEGNGTFLGWYTAASGGTKVEVDENGFPTGYTWESNSTLRLYAQWGRTAYAVCIYGIEQDIDSDGNVMGLTFGPALGGNYISGYVSHEVDTSGNITETDVGKTSSDNAYRCVHCDDWSTIIEWNKKDPYVYEKCIDKGCTHSVELDFSGSGLTSFKNDFVGTCSGDGPGVLYYELLNGNSGNTQYENVVWSSGSTYGSGWAASRVRAMLNGAQPETDITTTSGTYVTNAASVYTANNCLLAAFPAELQAAIGSRTTAYGASYSASSASYCCDKLFLFSTSEITSNTSLSSAYYHSYDSLTDNGLGSAAYYTKWTTGKLDASKTNTAYQGYYVNSSTGSGTGATYSWWLRSACSNFSSYAVYVRLTGYVSRYNVYYRSGIAPGFALSR